MKSPIGYPGGKSQAVKVIIPFIPNDKVICSPFLGGASIELALSALGRTVYGYDKDKELVNFWQCLLTDKYKLIKTIESYFPSNPTRHKELQPELEVCKDKWKKAAIYYYLNRTSWGCKSAGATTIKETYRWSKPSRSLYKFRIPDNPFSVEHGDFKTTLEKHESVFCYLDPPYYNKEKGKLYKVVRKEGFDHAGLYSILKNRNNWILSYDDIEWVRDTYAGFKMISPYWTYMYNFNGVANDTKELLIFSKDLEDRTKHPTVHVQQENNIIKFGRML